ERDLLALVQLWRPPAPEVDLDEHLLILAPARPEAVDACELDDGRGGRAHRLRDVAREAAGEERIEIALAHREAVPRRRGRRRPPVRAPGDACRRRRRGGRR